MPGTERVEVERLRLAATTARPRAIRTEKIRDGVREVFEPSEGSYGSRKMVEALAELDELASVCRNTVVKAMRDRGLHSCVAKTFKPTTSQADPSKAVAPNVLDQEAQAAATSEI